VPDESVSGRSAADAFGDRLGPDVVAGTLAREKRYEARNGRHEGAYFDHSLIVRNVARVLGPK
jgi:hypothetical protein